MSNTANPTDLRPTLLKTYKYVVNNWAVDATEVATSIGVSRKEADRLLKRLATAGLLDSTHVNGEKSLTWQSYHDVNNEANVARKSTADFNKAFPKGEEVPEVATVKRNAATGARYTDNQLEAGRNARVAGASWAEVAKVAKVKSPFHFSKSVRKAFPKVEADRKRAEKATKKAKVAA